MSLRASVFWGRVVRMSRVRGGMSSRESIALLLGVVVGCVDAIVFVFGDLSLEVFDEVDGERDSGGSGGGT